MSPGEQLIDIVHVHDVCTAFIMAAERLLGGDGVGHERYAVSSGAPLPMKDLVRTFEKVAGVTLPIEWGGRPYRPREVMQPWTKGRPLPGWTPKISLERGLKESLDD